MRQLLPGLACLLALLTPGCFPAIERPVTVDPERAPSLAWDRLRAVRSFRFRLRYHTDRPFELGSDLSGVWQAPDRESWSGTAWRIGERWGVELVGSGADQYEKSGSGWSRTARGVETQVFEQAHHVLLGKKLQFEEEAGNRYRYRFNPSVRILDPAKTKSFTGVLEIDRRYGLPTRIHCSDLARTAEWELVLDRFNRAGQVKVPFVAELEVEIALAGRVSRSGLGLAVTVLRERLESLGWEYRLNREWGRLVLRLDRRISGRQLELLLSAGRVEVWRGVWVGDSPAADSARSVVVGGDAARRVLLSGMVAGNGGFRAGSGAELLPEPRLVLEFEEPLPAGGDSGSVLVLLVNGEAVGSCPGVDSAAADFFGLGNQAFVEILAAVANSPALGTGFRIARMR